MKQVGRYQILEELHRGATGTMFKALDPADSRIIAIKTICLTELPGDTQEIRERLFREVQSAALLSHPNIVTVYGIADEGQSVHIFMEFVQGSSLEEMRRIQALPENPALLESFKQIGDALDYAHRKGIVHRHLEPSNIIISERGTEFEPLAKIADFGVAKLVSPQITEGGAMIGTPSYMSPEQIQGTPLDGRSDQFSLAVIIYEILSGTKPFIAENLPALFYLICKQDPPGVHLANSKLNASVSRILERALAKDANDRYTSCGAFIDALSVELESLPEWIGSREPVVVGRTVAEEKKLSGVAPANGSISASGAVPTPHEGPLLTPPPNASGYELPRLSRRRRGFDEAPDESKRRTSSGKKLLLLLAFFLAVAGAAVFVKQWNPAPQVPVQVLDTKSGPVSPPPQDAGTANPSSAPPKQHQDSSRSPAPARKTTEPARSANSTSLHTSTPPPQAAPDTTAEAATRDVELLTDPPGAKIVVDNRFDNVCTSPCTLGLRSGRHTLTADLNGYTEARRIFTVPQDSSLFVTLNKSVGVLIVTSSPPGASIFVDGKDYGHTPSTLRLPAGPHRLVLVNGALRHQETIQIENEGFSARNFRFDR
ncbi:MAG: protein kinase [Acidobacteriaceae bacterium]|nr:protein kinase [Acidobacteriaceae bacterium]MBV9780853.1 protein kinase [Acidobacteriaceae bacterium]